MADLSKIKLNGIIYNLKDAWLRENMPQPCSDEDVIEMLTSYGLYNSESLTPAIAGSAELDKAVVQANKLL